MKKIILYRKTLTSALLLAIFFAVASLSGCENSWDVLNNDNNTDISLHSVWVCKPESNVNITMTFDSGQVYVNTYPFNLRDTVMSAGKYLFNNEDIYIDYHDTLFFINHDASIANYGFIKTMISSDKMVLQSFGIGLPALYTWITNYSFERKNNY